MWTLVLVLCFSPVLGFYSYSEHYPEEEYEYSEEQEEEGVASYVPVFLTSPNTVWVSQGGRARLECRVDRLGPMVLSWSRVDRANSTYLATGAMLLVTNPRLTVELAASSSTLFITGVEARDEGEYLCQASSQPPVHVKLSLRLKVPPGASILGRPSSGVLIVRRGEELALVCRGSGQPAPRLSWSRQDQLLPDGSRSLAADQMIFSHVTPSHSGTYTCHGGPGVNQSVEVVVEFPPLVSLDQSYQHRARGGSSLELVCTVEAVPAARVEWWRSGMSLAGLGEVGGRAKVEYREPGRHLLTLDNPTEEDLGVYSCSANNTEGEARATIDVSGAGSEMPVARKAMAPLKLIAKADTLQRAEKEEENHLLLKHIVHKMNKFDKLHKDIVTAIKESNRFLLQLLRDQKKLLPDNDSKNIRRDN